MVNGGDFREQVKKLGKLIAEFDGMPDGQHKTACRVLVQTLMDVHAAGLEKLMQIVFEEGSPGTVIIDKLGEDTTAGGLLLLYSLHPDDLETRVLKAMKQIKPLLGKHDCTAEIVDAHEGAVQVRISSSRHNCGSSTKDVRAIVEESIYEFAPDVASLEISGPDEPSPVGFVPLERLLGQCVADAQSNGHPRTRVAQPDAPSYDDPRMLHA